MISSAKRMVRNCVKLAIAAFCIQSTGTCLALNEVAGFNAVKQDQSLHITAVAESDGPFANTQLLIDTDNDAKTGYKPAGVADHGFDIMVEGTTVYRFKGNDASAWSWDKAGSATKKVKGGTLSLDVELSLLGGRSSTASVLLRTLSPDYQMVTASSPATAVDLKKSPGNTKKTGASVATDFNASLKQDGADLVIKVTTHKPADIDTLLIFFDTDNNNSTGFSPPADPHFGFEQMIQGESLSAHTGDTRDGWSWTTIAPIKKTVDGLTAEFRFNATLLKSKQFHAAVWQMSADWQSRTDKFPANEQGTTEVVLDAAKLQAQVVQPPMPFAEPRANRDLPTRERFQKIASYCCYYGAGKTSDLSHFDAAILHTPAQTADEVKKLNDLGVVTIGYISVGEDETLRVGNGAGPGGKASWYFDKNNTGKPDKNGTWASYYANAEDPLWRADRVVEAKRLCQEVGFQGIFLDTVETCDAYPQSRAGMIQLIGELRAALPDKVIVINRGFSLLKEKEVSAHIDGLMFESFTDSYDFDSKQYIEFAPQDLDATRQVMVANVLPAVKQYPLKVLALDYCKPDQTDRIQRSFDRAATFGMIPAVSLISLDQVYDTTHVKAQVNPRFLTRQATPESLSITLTDEQNGFPAGTRLEPSSCFLGYTAAAVVDGIKNRQSLHWSKAAWASAEEPGSAQQLEFIFPTTITGGNLTVAFAVDNGTVETSKRLRIEIKTADDKTWTELPATIDAHTAKCMLPADPIHRLRIVQSPGGGSSGRPDLMWIAQVKRAN